MKIYLASRFRTVKQTNDFAKELREQGHTIVSTWHDTEAIMLPLPKPEIGRASSTSFQIARKDLSEIISCDALIVLSQDCEATPGGLWFEAGYALGIQKPVYIVGPRFNVFCHLLLDWYSGGFAD